MTSSNGSIFRVTGHLCGEFVPGEFRARRPMTHSFDVFFDLRLNKRLSKQPWGWWFETPSWSLWHHGNGNYVILYDPNYNNVLRNEKVNALNITIILIDLTFLCRQYLLKYQCTPLNDWFLGNYPHMPSWLTICRGVVKVWLWLTVCRNDFR